MATFEEVGRLVIKCCRYFERKEPAPATLELWYEELKDLDATHFDGLISKFGKIDGWPRNFPVKIREVYGMVTKEGKGWTSEEYVNAYYMDHQDDINREAHRKGVDVKILSWAEMTYPLVIKGDITKSRAIWYWNRAKKGELPDYLRGSGNEIPKNNMFKKLYEDIGKIDEIPF